MRRAGAIIKATALEILSEPLVFLVMIAAMSLAVLAPALHYHEFGDPSKMARDAGVSAILVGGLIVAAFGAVKTMRREVETQTALTALSLPVSRRMFFLAKTAGVFFAYLVFVVTVGSVSIAAVRGAVIGGEIAAREHSVARMFGPILAFALAAIVIPFVYGAVMNHSFRRRFTLHAGLCAGVLSLVAMSFRFDLGLFLKTLEVYSLVAIPALIMLAASAAFSIRFRYNTAMSLALLVFALFLPALGSYCVTDVVSAGEPVPAKYLLAAFVAVLPPVAALLYLGTKLFENAE